MQYVYVTPADLVGAAAGGVAAWYFLGQKSPWWIAAGVVAGVVAMRHLPTESVWKGSQEVIWAMKSA